MHFTVNNIGCISRSIILAIVAIMANVWNTCFTLPCLAPNYHCIQCQYTLTQPICRVSVDIFTMLLGDYNDFVSISLIKDVVLIMRNVSSSSLSLSYNYIIEIYLMNLTSCFERLKTLFSLFDSYLLNANNLCCLTGKFMVVRFL